MDITGTLAKLLATENLTVQHSASAHTASFNVKDRVLTLPVLTGASQEVMTMFAAHEVGHALQTPSDWTEQVIAGTPFDFVNVIEDVRIEKYIQAKFPGLKRDFSKGYSELNDKDFFRIADQDVNKMSLIDRLNLHFKLGYRAVIEFAADEQQWVQAIDECDTFQKVCLCAKMLSDWLDQKKEDEQEANTQDQQSDGAGDEDGESEEQQQTEAQGEDEEQQDFGSKGRKGDEEEQPEENEEVEEEGAGGDEGSDTDEKVSKTQQAMTEQLKDLTGKSGGGQHVVSQQTGDLGSIIDLAAIRESFRHHEGYSFGIDAKEEFTKFILSTKKEVNHMVQRFEMKKSADAYARASQNKTGVLNTGRLHQYKLTDDIFLRQTVTPDGKSHGMVMFVDWSGSMSNQLIDTVKQLLVLVQFCRKVQIAFQVFAFTTPGQRSRWNEDITLAGKLANDAVGLYEVLNSTAKKRDLENDMLNFFSQALTLERGNSITGPYSDLLQLGGTPLDNALTMVPAIIDQFRSATGAQKVSFVALTDGQSSPIMYYEGREDGCRLNYGYYDNQHVKFGNESFHVTCPYNISDTAGIISILKKVTTEVTFTNIFIGSKGASDSHMRSNGGKFDASSFTKNGGCASKGFGWDLVSCLNSKNFNNTQEDIEVEDGAKKGQIKTALKKFLKAQSTAKVILNALVDNFA